MLFHCLSDFFAVRVSIILLVMFSNVINCQKLFFFIYFFFWFLNNNYISSFKDLWVNFVLLAYVYRISESFNKWLFYCFKKTIQNLIQIWDIVYHFKSENCTDFTIVCDCFNYNNILMFAFLLLTFLSFCQF